MPLSPTTLFCGYLLFVLLTKRWVLPKWAMTSTGPRLMWWVSYDVNLRVPWPEEEVSVCVLARITNVCSLFLRICACHLIYIHPQVSSLFNHTPHKHTPHKYTHTHSFASSHTKHFNSILQQQIQAHTYPSVILHVSSDPSLDRKLKKINS